VTNHTTVAYSVAYRTDRFIVATSSPDGPAPAVAPNPILAPGRSGYREWLTAALGPDAHPDLDPACGELSDPDRDGLCNLLEYAFGGHPLEPTPLTIQPSGQVDLIDGEHYLCLTYYRRKNAPDLRYQVEGSVDLGNWKSGPGYAEEFQVVELAPAIPGFERVTVRRIRPIEPGEPIGFLRVRVEIVSPPPAIPLRISYQAAEDALLLEWPTTAGAVYRLEFSPDAQSWQPVPGEESLLGTGTTLRHTLPRPGHPHRFLRVTRP
jgi:hypothetical protein